MTTVLGIDACKGGWVSVELRGGRFFEARYRSALRDLVLPATHADAIAVDIPLGLMDAEERTADRKVRAMLGRRGSSVFITPPRPVFAEPDYDAAKILCASLVGWMPSQQAWGLRVKLLEANKLYETTKLFEVHPELSFLGLGLRLEDGGKKSFRGQRARLRVLKAAGIVLPEDLGEALDKIPGDDILDAAAAAWSADRIARGVAERISDPPQMNEPGQSIAIWY
jgi:predicted RNase H-like nuclease